MNLRIFGVQLLRSIVGAAVAVLLGLSSAHAYLLYASTGDLNALGGGRIYTIDPDTQAVTLVGDTGLSRTGALAFDANGVLYAAGWGGVLGPVSLYNVSTTNGAATLVGAVTGIEGVDALAFNSAGTLYGGGWRDADGGILLTLDTGTGAPLTSVVMTGSGNYFAAGLAFNELDVLYGSRGGSFRTEDFITIDISTGEQTAIGGMTAEISDIWFAPDGTLYGASPRTRFLYEIDPVTGAKTPLFNTGIRISGLTGREEVVVPEPVTLALLGAGLLALGIARRRGA